MRNKMLVLVSLVIVASLLAACSPSRAQVSLMIGEALAKQGLPVVNVQVPEQPAPTINVQVPEQPAPTINVQVPEQETQVEEPALVVQEPEIVQEPEVVHEMLVVTECPLVDKGIRIEFEGPDEGEFYLLSGFIQILEPYQGCNFLIEGRQFLTEEHHIWVFQGPEWQLKVREGSLWAYPLNWNMSDFSTVKPPIAAEFVTAKRNNQKANGYDWVIFVHVGNDTYEFPAGAITPEVVLPDNAQFSEPEPIAVQGVWNGESFNASIGGERTITVALLDGQLFYWADARDNIVYKTVQAWTMPSGWSLEQIESWAAEKFPSQDLVDYIG